MSFTGQPVELVDAGENQVVAVVQISGRAKFSGVETTMTFAAIYKSAPEGLPEGASTRPAPKLSKPSVWWSRRWRRRTFRS
jgi:hypothetical protein